MKLSRAHRLPLALILVLTLAACSSPGPTKEAAIPESPLSPSATSAPSKSVTKGDKDRGQDGKKKPGEKGSPVGGDAGSPDSTEGSDSGDGPSEPGGSSGDPALGFARVFDSTGDADASGETPAYVDLIEASVEGLGRTVRLSATFRGQVPAKMPDDDTFMSVETEIHKGGRSYFVYADADDEGWTAYITQKDDSRRLEGAFSRAGDTTRLEIPWGMIGGPGELRWKANSAWTRTTLTNTYFAFDTAPEPGRARYPT